MKQIALLLCGMFLLAACDDRSRCQYLYDKRYGYLNDGYSQKYTKEWLDRDCVKVLHKQRNKRKQRY